MRRTKDLFLTYGGGDLQIDGFTNFDFQSDIDDRKSIFRFIFICNGGAVSWKSSKQGVTTNSIIEAEYIVASDTAKEDVWIKKFSIELGIVPSIESLIPLYYDNNGAITLIKELRSQKKSKHIERHFHIIREFVGKGDVLMQKVASVDNVDDPLTKALTQL